MFNQPRIFLWKKAVTNTEATNKAQNALTNIQEREICPSEPPISPQESKKTRPAVQQREMGAGSDRNRRVITTGAEKAHPNHGTEEKRKREILTIERPLRGGGGGRIQRVRVSRRMKRRRRQWPQRERTGEAAAMEGREIGRAHV